MDLNHTYGTSIGKRVGLLFFIFNILFFSSFSQDTIFFSNTSSQLIILKNGNAYFYNHYFTNDIIGVGKWEKQNKLMTVCFEKKLEYDTSNLNFIFSKIIFDNEVSYSNEVRFLDKEMVFKVRKKKLILRKHKMYMYIRSKYFYNDFFSLNNFE